MPRSQVHAPNRYEKFLCRPDQPRDDRDEFIDRKRLSMKFHARVIGRRQARRLAPLEHRPHDEMVERAPREGEADDRELDEQGAAVRGRPHAAAIPIFPTFLVYF